MAENGRISFGLMISSDEPPERDRRAIADEHLERAVVAHQAGIRTIVAGHRYSFSPARDQAKVPASIWRMQPFSVLAYIAGTLGGAVNYATAVVLSASANPVQLVEDAATLNTLCRGNFRLGLGLGWIPDEFTAFNVDYDDRVLRFEELLTGYRLLRETGRSTMEGKYFSWRDAEVLARGSGVEMPPLWIGGSVGVAVRRAARLGDAWVMSSHIDVDTLRAQKALFDSARAAAGLPEPEEIPVVRSLIIAADREEAMAIATPELRDWYAQRVGMGWAPSNDSDGDIRRLAAGRWIVGDPDDAVREIERLREEVGVTEIIFTLNWPGLSHGQRLKVLELLKSDVFPRLDGVVGAARAGGPA